MRVKPWLKLHDELGIDMPPFENRPLGQVVEDWAAKTPDAPALQYFTKTFSFADFDAEASKLAHALNDLGVGAGDVVGFHMPNLPQYSFALAAVSKIGAIGSGVSPLLAPPELAHQVRDAGIKVLISFSDLAPVVQGMGQPPACLEHVIFTGAKDYLTGEPFDLPELTGAKALHYLDIVRNQNDSFRQVDRHWNDTVMIQYTGGTTGPAKGAEISLRSIMSNPAMYLASDPPGDGGPEVFASAFPFFHIAGLSFALAATIMGGRMFVIPNPRDTDVFCDLMKAYPPTLLGAVPALYDMLAANPKFREIDFSRLRTAKTGAAPLTSTTYDTVSAIIGDNKMSDVLGMTETGPCYITHPVSRYKKGSVGIPMVGVDVRIRDSETGAQDMPFGEAGELCTAGPHLMKGYLNLPDESARALRDIDGERWMFSGDVAYMDEEGYVYLCDRAKDMLIVGGFKVFSVEVEDKLKAHPAIAESALIGEPDEKRPGNDIVHLYVQLSADYLTKDQQETKAEILDYMRTNMAAYKIPKAVHIIDEIPLTPVGKIDKKALRG